MYILSTCSLLRYAPQKYARRCTNGFERSERLTAMMMATTVKTHRLCCRVNKPEPTNEVTVTIVSAHEDETVCLFRWDLVKVASIHHGKR